METWRSDWGCWGSSSWRLLVLLVLQLLLLLLMLRLVGVLLLLMLLMLVLPLLLLFLPPLLLLLSLLLLVLVLVLELVSARSRHRRRRGFARTTRGDGAWPGLGARLHCVRCSYRCCCRRTSAAQGKARRTERPAMGRRALRWEGVAVPPAPPPPLILPPPPPPSGFQSCPRTCGCSPVERSEPRMRGGCPASRPRPAGGCSPSLLGTSQQAIVCLEKIGPTSLLLLLYPGSTADR